MYYSNGQAEGSIFASDDNLNVLVSIGRSYLFGETPSPRVLNGRINYVKVLEAHEVPNVNPTEAAHVPTTQAQRKKKWKKNRWKRRQKKKNRRKWGWGSI